MANIKPNLPQLYAIEFKKNKTSENFENLYKQTFKILYGFAKKFNPNIEDIEDIVYNVYLTIYDKIHLFDDKYTFVSWCYILIRNESIWLKDRKSIIESFSSDENDDNIEQSKNTKIEYKMSEMPNYSYLDLSDKDIDREDVLLNTTLSLIDKCPDLWKDFIIDRHFDNLSMEELAAKYNVCENTAKTRLRQGRLWIQNEFEKITGEKFQYAIN